MRQQIDDVSRRMRVDAREDVGEVIDRVHAVRFALRNEAIEDGEVLAGDLASHEEEVFSSEGDSAQRRLRTVIVRCESRDTKKPAERPEVLQQVANSLADARARLESVTVAACPNKKFRKEGTRPLMSEGAGLLVA